LSRERDVRTAIMDALQATGEFDLVNTGQDKGQEVNSDGNSFAHVDPHDAQEASHWDDGGGAGVEVISRCRITLSVSNNDPQTRDEHLEKLLNITQNIVNDQSLAELTLPSSSRIRSWRWLPAKAPLRQVEAIFEFHYLPDSSQDFGTEE
jgi:hypothetical protein